MTEVGPDLETEGGESLEPGREDVSERIAEEKPHNLVHGELAEEDAVLEGNVEEIKDEGRLRLKIRRSQRLDRKKAARSVPRFDEAEERGFSTFRG